MKTQLEKLNDRIGIIEDAIRITTGSHRAKLQARRTMLIEKRRKLLLRKPAVGKKLKALLTVVPMIVAFDAYLWYATSPGRCGFDRTWTGLPCPRSAPPDGFCAIHEPIVKAHIAELQRELRERSK